VPSLSLRHGTPSFRQVCKICTVLFAKHAGCCIERYFQSGRFVASVCCLKPAEQAMNSFERPCDLHVQYPVFCAWILFCFCSSIISSIPISNAGPQLQQLKLQVLHVSHVQLSSYHGFARVYGPIHLPVLGSCFSFCMCIAQNDQFCSSYLFFCWSAGYNSSGVFIGLCLRSCSFFPVAAWNSVAPTLLSRCGMELGRSDRHGLSRCGMEHGRLCVVSSQRAMNSFERPRDLHDPDPVFFVWVGNQ